MVRPAGADGGGGGGAGGGGGGGGGGGAPPEPLPFERLSRTFEPGETLVPACGRCATTVPRGCDDGTVKALGTRCAARIAATASDRLWPTTFGTCTPRETRIRTDAFFETSAPAAGLWETTTPEGSRERTLVRSTVNPRARRSRVATGASSPTTSGTVTVLEDETDRFTTEPRVMRVPGPGSSTK